MSERTITLVRGADRRSAATTEPVTQPAIGRRSAATSEPVTQPAIGERNEEKS